MTWYKAIIGVLVLLIIGSMQETHNLQNMYMQDIKLSYNAGVMHGVQKAIDDKQSSVEIITIVFSKYPKCVNPRQEAEWVVEYATKYEVPPVILALMICQESSCNPEALSSCGARGLTQIRWKYWGDMLKKVGIANKESDLNNRRISIQAGAYILRYLLDKYDQSLEKAFEHFSGSANHYMEKVIRRVKI